MLPIEERKAVIENLRMVYKVFGWDDNDKSACGAIEHMLTILEKKDEKLIFANGGDRNIDNIPEFENFKGDKRVLFKFKLRVL